MINPQEFKNSLFETPVWSFVLSELNTSKILERILELESKETSVHKSNIGGFQTRDTLDKDPAFKEFILYFEDIANDVLKEYKCSPVYLDQLWANINYHKDFNAAHIHQGIISGVFYIQVPQNSGRLVLCNPAVRGDGNILRSPNFAMVPQKNVLVIFPSWLEHYVEPNLSNEKRISISFNFLSK